MPIEYVNVTVTEEVIQADVVEETISAPVVQDVVDVTVSEEIIQADIAEEVIQAEIVEETIQAVIEGYTPCACPPCPSPGSGGGTSGQVFVTEVTGSGNIANVQYAPNTVPANAVVTEVTTDHDNVVVHFMAEGGENYSPVVTAGSVTCSDLQQYSNDQRLFYGTLVLSISTTQTVTIESTAGGDTEVIINRAAAGPDILTCTIGAYPGSQTAAKQGDTIHVTGTVESSATQVRLLSYGAFAGTGWINCSGGTFDITGTVSSATGLQRAQVEAKNSIGTVGSTFTSTNQITLDQTYPSFTDNGTTFPTGQTAFKGTETGSQSTTVSGADVFVYSSPNGHFTISNDNGYDESKNITCTNPGTYNDSSNSFRIVATRSANNAQSVFNKVIEVADVAPTVTISQPYSRLRSSPSGSNYTISANSNQNLASAPSVLIPVSGTWQGSGFTGGPKNWSRIIRISDADAKGTGSWAWDGAAPKNRAGLSATISGTQNNGGFASRNLTLDAFATETDLDTAVVTTAKLVMTWSFKSGMTFQAIGTSPPVVNGWTIDATGINPTSVEILDTAAAGASSQASTITIEETV